MSCCEHHNVNQLIELFNNCFAESFSTVLINGGQEPVYLPASEGKLNRIIFTRDYFSSALHEIAHWCIAGAERRQLEDFGYWYKPDGRSEEEQKSFEQVEIKPQALEYIFSKAADHIFHFSADNLGQGLDVSSCFKQAVMNQVDNYQKSGLPPRAQEFHQALIGFYRS